jgi:hypothetical protein
MYVYVITSYIFSLIYFIRNYYFISINYIMAVPPAQMNFPLTTLHLTDVSDNHVNINGSGITCPVITPASIYDASGTHSLGLSNQVLSAGVSGGSLLWVDLPASVTPSLADVVAVATAGDFGAQALSNTPSIAMTAGEASAVSLSAIPASDVLDISTEPDDSGFTKDFTRKYGKISFHGTLYYIPLFRVPPPE